MRQLWIHCDMEISPGLCTSPAPGEPGPGGEGGMVTSAAEILDSSQHLPAGKLPDQLAIFDHRPPPVFVLQHVLRHIHDILIGMGDDQVV